MSDTPFVVRKGGISTARCPRCPWSTEDATEVLAAAAFIKHFVAAHMEPETEEDR